MASRLDQALDEVIKERRGERSSGRRHNNSRYNDKDNDRSRPSRDDFTRRRHMDSDGVIRKRVGPSTTISSFVRTVNVGGESVSKFNLIVSLSLARTLVIHTHTLLERKQKYQWSMVSRYV